MVFVYAHNAVIRQGMGIGGVFLRKNELAGLRIKPVQSIIGCHPIGTGSVLVDLLTFIMADAVRIIRVMLKARE